MADYKGKSFAGQLQLLMETQPDFPQRFKQRLVFESSKVANPIKFIARLISKGVLCDGSNHSSEANFGLKEMMVQLAEMLVCSKGAPGIGGLMEALEESGNSELISALRTWIKDEFVIETDGDLSEPKEVASVLQARASETGAEEAKKPTGLSAIGCKLIDRIMSRMEDDFMGRIEGYWIGQASKIVNVPEFCSSLAHQGVLRESDKQQKTGMELKQEELAQEVIKVAVSKRAIASLVLAFQLSGNDSILQETQNWLETSQVRKKNYPIAVKALRNQLKHQTPKIEMAQFFKQAPPLNSLQKVATFNCSPDSCTGGQFSLEFGKEKMMASFSGGTVKLWNWSENAETTVKLGDKVKGLTAFQYDEEILVLGTHAGTVHLFDAKKLEEKWSDRLGEPVHSVKIVESTLLVVTQNGSEDKLWCVEISRSDMQLKNRRPLMTISKDKKYGLLIDQGCFFVYHSNLAPMHYLTSGENVRACGRPCSLEAPAVINILTLVKFIGETTFVIAGCENGAIVIWCRWVNLGPRQKPFKTFYGHKEAIVGLCGINGHLLSVCQGGKLLMWSGHDLQNPHVTPIPRVLAENVSNVTCLVACERWFASSSSEDGTINIWTLPDLWLRTG